MSLAVGTALGPYRILARIAAGGMGEVYRAADPKLEREVAIKVLPAHLGQQAEWLDRFEREAKAVAALSHPNVMGIFDFGREGDLVYAVMELLEGETLRERLSAGPVPARRAAEWGAQIARGLAAAHEKGIVHRDLKPDNLYLTKDGPVKILDFGLAKRLPAGLGELAAHPETLGGALLGTVGYMSPEQARGEAVDRRSDLFSLGAVLYEMVAGQGPFARPSATETLAAILMDDPPGLEAAGVPPGLMRVIEHCLEKRPDARFQSARDVAFALETLSDFSGPIRPFPRWRRRRGRWGGALAAMILLPGALLLGWLWPRVESQPVFHRLSFREGWIRSARFTPDGGGVVYSAAWGEDAPRIFTSRLDTLEDRDLGLPSAHLLALTPSGDLALQEQVQGPFGWIYRGTLSRATLGGSSPKALLPDVEWADWSPSGQLAVIRTVDEKGRVECPPGQVRLESAGWYSHLRFSPSGDRLAFIEHPLPNYSRGNVQVLDLASGQVKTVSGVMSSLEGLCWKGSELWYTGAPEGFHRILFAVDPRSGRTRVVLRIPGGMTVYEVSAKGTVLVGVEDARSGILRMEGQAAKDVGLRTWSVFRDMSGDGRVVLFDEEMDATGPDYDLFLRRAGEPSAMLVGQGTPSALSPNGAWVATIQHRPSPHPVLIPTGAGEARHLPAFGMEAYLGPLAFTADSRGLAFGANEPGAGPRLYLMDTFERPPHPITPEGFLANLGEPFLSPKGDVVLARSKEGALLFSLATGRAPRAAKGLESGERIMRWHVDGQGALVFRPGILPVEIWQVDFATGQRRLWRRLAPPGYLGDLMSHTARATEDGRGVAFTFRRLRTTLYAVDGLR